MKFAAWLLLLATAAPAVCGILSDEVPLGVPTVYAPPPRRQFLDSVASDGTDFLVLWADERGRGDFYAGRLRSDGTPTKPVGQRLAPMWGTDAKLAWTGSSYLFVFPSAGGWRRQTLDRDGVPLDDPVPFDVGPGAARLTSNGRTLLVFENDGRVLVATLNGSPITVQSIGTLSITMPEVLEDGDYAFVSEFAWSPQQLVIVDGTTGIVTTRPLPHVTQDADVAEASINGRFLVAWNELVGMTEAVNYEIIDSPCNVLVPPVKIFPPGSEATPLRAASDGSEFLLVVGRDSYRINQWGEQTGHQADQFPVRGEAAFARGTGTVVAVWEASLPNDPSQSRHLLSSAAVDFRSLVEAPVNNVAGAPHEQSAPHVAPGGTFAAWREQTLAGEIDAAAMNGPPALVTNAAGGSAPAVARGTDVNLVVWDGGGFGDVTILAKRFGSDGIPLDAAPTVLGRGEMTNGYGHTSPATAFDGTNFLVVWPCGAGVCGTRVAENGAVLDPTPIVIASDSSEDLPLTRAVVWTGREYVVGWLNQPNPSGATSPVYPAKVRFARVAPSGQVLDPNPAIVWQTAPTFLSQIAPAQRLALAANEDGVTAIWLGNRLSFDETCIWSVQLRADATPAAQPRTLRCTPYDVLGTFDSLDLAWSGSEFVVVWSTVKRDRVVGQRFTPLLRPMDFEPFLVSETAYQVSIAPTPTGTAIAYVRVTDEPQFGGVWRAFVRTLDRGSPSAHHRAVGH